LSQPPARLAVSQLSREGLAKTCQVSIGTRQFRTPGFLIRIDSKDKLELYLRVKRIFPTQHLSGFVIRLPDAHRILGPRISNVNQLDLQGGFVETDFIRSAIRDFSIFDPSLEHLYYRTHLRNFASAPDMPEILGDFAARHAPANDGIEAEPVDRPEQNQIETAHTNFWRVLERDERVRTRFLRDLLRLQVQFGATVLVPPVPLITNSENLFELSKTINVKAQEVSRLIGECAYAFTFRVDTLRNQAIIDDLKRFVSQSPARLTILKFKNMNLNEEEKIAERAAFRNLMQELDLVSRIKPNRTFMLLESGNQTLPCAGRGFDFLSTSFNMDREFRRRRVERSPWGKWYDPKYLLLRGRNEFLTTFRNNGNRIPDDCDECRVTPRADALDIDGWNAYVKRHYLQRREKDCTEIDEAVQNGTATAGIINRLKDSALKNLVELVR